MPVAYGIWVYSGAVAGCFAMDASRAMVCLIRRDGPRYEPSSRLSARRPTLLVTGRVQASLEDLYRQFAVHTLGVLVSTEQKSGETTKALPFYCNVTNRRPTAHSKY